MRNNCKIYQVIGLSLLLLTGAVEAAPRVVSARASSFSRKNLPARAFDNTPGTAWQASKGKGWLSCKFAREVALTGITTHVNKAHLMDIRIQVRAAKSDVFQTIAMCKDFNGFENDGKWEVSFAPVKAVEVRTIIDRCTHKEKPKGRGEWPYIYEQTFQTGKAAKPPKAVSPTLAPELPVCAVPLVDKGLVTLDGKLGESQWAQASFVSNFSWEGTLVPNQTVVRVFATRSHLYVGATLYEPTMRKIRAKCEEDSFGVWADDCMELFISPENKPSAYSQIAINSNGAKLVQSQRKNGGKLLDFVVATRKHKKSWAIETAIPFTVAGMTGVKAGDAIRINFCRNAAARKQYSTWSALSGGFHKPNRFGRVMFVDGEGFSSLGIQPLKFAIGGEIEASVSGSSARQLELLVNGAIENKVKIAGQGVQRVSFKPKSLPCTLQLSVSDKNGNRLYRTARVRLEKDELQQQAELLSALLGEIEKGLRQGQFESLRKRLNKLEQRFAAVKYNGNRKSKLKAMRALRKKGSELRLDVFAAANNQPAVVSFATAMKKLLPGQPWGQPLCKNTTIHTARRDFESTQVVLFARKGDLRNIRLALGEFADKSGRRFTGRIELYNVENVRWRAGGGTRVLPGNVYPDPLRPHKRFDLKAGQSKAVWVEVETPADVVPGDYSGKLKVQWDGGKDVLELQIKVYPVTLPKAHTLKTPFVISPRYVAEGHGLEMGSKAFLAMLEKYRKFNVRYKLDWLYFDGYGSCQQTLYPKCIKDGSNFRWDFTDYDKKMQQYFDEGMRTFAVGMSWAHLPKTVLNPDGSINKKYSGCAADKLSAAEFRAFQKALADYAKHLKAKGWLDKAFYYVADEPRAEHYNDVRKQAKFLLDTDAGWKPMVTAMCPSLGDVFNIWCPNVAFFDPKLSEQQQASGKEVWWYVCVGRYHPNYYVDYQAIDPRIHFWLTYRYGITGVLYWRVNHYGKGDRFKEAIDGGDGYIFYPGPAGPLPSIRAMMIRDGIEDYDLLKMLEKQAPKSKLLDMGNVCKSLGDYTTEPKVLQKRRIAILRELSCLPCGGE